MFDWIRGLFRGFFRARRSPEGRELFDALSEREQQILLREMADSSRNAMASPGDSLAGSEGFMDSLTKMALNPAVRSGSIPNLGIPSQSLDETRGN